MEHFSRGFRGEEKDRPGRTVKGEGGESKGIPLLGNNSGKKGGGTRGRQRVGKWGIEGKVDSSHQLRTVLNTQCFPNGETPSVKPLKLGWKRSRKLTTKGKGGELSRKFGVSKGFLGGGTKIPSKPGRGKSANRFSFYCQIRGRNSGIAPKRKVKGAMGSNQFIQASYFEKKKKGTEKGGKNIPSITHR